MTYFSDAIIDFLHQQEIRYVSFNPGASFRGIHDSLVHPDNADKAARIVMCCHEEVAVAIAHGYYKASHRHMAVLIHANVGLLHATMAIFNAWCDRVPLLLLGGNGPLDAGKRRPWIDWIHTSQNIGSVVEDYVKWCDAPIGQWSTMESLYRGLRLMNTEVQAPVYIAVDFETQEQERDPGVSLLPKHASQPARLPAVDKRALDDLAGRLLDANLPVLIVDFAGRDPDTVPLLETLVDRLGLAVIDRGNRYNLPNTHALNLSGATVDWLAEADVIVALEVQDLLGALKSFLPVAANGTLPTDRYLVTIGTSDLLISKWAADYQQLVTPDHALIGDSAGTLAGLLDAVRDHPKGSQIETRERRRERVARIVAAHRHARQGWEAEAAAQAERPVITVASATRAIRDALRHENWVLANTGSLTIDGWVKKLWPLQQPGCYLGLNGGGGLGYGLGASIGAAIALQESGKLVVNLQADGDMLYTPEALWTLSAYAVPLLIVVMNNRLYLNSHQHAVRIAQNRDRTVEHAHIATSFYDNPVDFVGLARAFNVEALPRVETLADVGPAIDAAVALIRTKAKPVLVEITMD